MPEAAPKSRPHPSNVRSDAPLAVRAGGSACFAELAVTSNFTFLTGASHPDEYARRAAELGYRGIALTDTNTLAGIVRAHSAAKEAGVPFIAGCRLVLADPRHFTVLVYPTDVASYGRLCKLLTLGKRRAPKAHCHITLEDLLEHSYGLLAIAVPPRRIDDAYFAQLRKLKGWFDDDRLSISATCCYGPDDAARLREIARLCDETRLPMVAVQEAHYHVPGRRMLQDVVTCIRHGCALDEAGHHLLPNGERYLKPPQEIDRLFRGYPSAVARTMEIARRASGFSLDQLRYQYPSEVVPEGATPIGHLTRLTWEGAAWRYPDGVTDKVRSQIAYELALIEELQYAHYFLTVHDLVRYSRSIGILCQGRGAAANSAVCYCLGVTEVNPAFIDVLFERFVSRERKEPPDIDIDFEHERREEAIQYLYQKYGRDRAALTAEVITYRGRSAVREVGKALGLSLDVVDRLAKNIDWWGKQGPESETLRLLKLDPKDVTIAHFLRLSLEIQGFPRHLGQHVGGFVLTETPLSQLVPIENAAMPDRTVIEWDKDDLDAMGFIKVDVLGLGMLSCLHKGFDLLDRHHNRPMTIATLPHEEPEVYDMICKADTVGVFQIESRAQMSMLPRLRPRCFYDLVIEVAIVRPGPIQGGMVHPYLRRRMGKEKITYASLAAERILRKTLGVPLFQEQAMQLAIDCAGFTPDEADKLRRAVTGFRRYGDLEDFQSRFISGMIGNGYERSFAERCFEQIKGFSSYGFPESHSASFALLVYASSWIKCHYPEVFACALLNSQPMGFYAPAQIVIDAQRHGVEVRAVDVHFSQWECTLEESDEGAEKRHEGALRLGMNRVKGLRQEDAEAIVSAVKREGLFTSIEALWKASSASTRAFRLLAAADAFGSMGLDRQSALWHARKLRDEEVPLFDLKHQIFDPDRSDNQAELLPHGRGSSERDRSGSDLAPSCLPRDLPVPLPKLPELRHVIQDYGTIGLSLRRHPISFLRDYLSSRRAITAEQIVDPKRYPSGRGVTVAGLCLVRQHPGTAKGITFMTLEDETGVVNLVVRPQVYDRFKRIVRGAGSLLVRGRVDRAGEVIHVIATSLESLDDRLLDLRTVSRDFH